MILNLNQLSKKSIEGTISGNKMKLSADSTSIIFQMFINNKYSNPIGSIVREITSNCFDSHVEANVNTPVIVRKSHDSETDQYHISFIDFGVGMSPERIDNIYSTFFSSTKREDNNQIGGYGIGSKVPLAYKRKTGYGTNEYDNSFFIITSFNSTKYYYCIYEGNETPEISLLHSELTDEGNGTEVRIPMLKSDIGRFETEVIKQLYYFENLIFEGFDNNEITNDYQIINAKNFLYRGDKVSTYAHVCLGRVAYKIDYNILEENSYEYQFPVAIKFNIGELGVNDSRESLDYSTSTIKLLKERLIETKNEIFELLSKQNDGIIELNDYLRVVSSKKTLIFSPSHSFNVTIEDEDEKIVYNNFKYKHLNLPSDNNLFSMFFEHSILGKRETNYEKRKGNSFNKTYDNLLKFKEFVYYTETSIIRNNLRSAYLRSIHDRYYVLNEREDFHFNDATKLFKNCTITIDDINNLKQDYFNIIKENCENYNEIVIPESFIIERKKRRLLITGEANIKIFDGSNYNNTGSGFKVKISDIIGFNGTIFYSTKSDEAKIKNAAKAFKICFNRSIISGLNYDNKTKSTDPFTNGNKNDKTNIMFIIIAQSTLKYMKMCKKAISVNLFSEKMLYRKVDMIKESIINNELINRIDNINKIILKDRFGIEFPEVVKHVKSISKFKNNTIAKITSSDYAVREFIDISKNSMNKKQIEINNSIEIIENINSYFNDYLNYISLPNFYYENKNNTIEKFWEIIVLLGNNCNLLKTVNV